MEHGVSEIKPLHSFEGNIGLGEHEKQDQQSTAFGLETINKSIVLKDNAMESKIDSLSLGHQLDIANKRKDDHMNGNKVNSPVRAKGREEPVGRERFNKGKIEKIKLDADKSEKTKSESKRSDRDRKREASDKGKIEKELIASSPPLKKMDLMTDDEIEYNCYMREQGSGHINATNGLGRTFDGGPDSGNREYETRGFPSEGNELGQEIRSGFQEKLPSADEGYVRGYHIKSGGSDGFGRLHTSTSEDYVRGIQLSQSANRDEEYAPTEVTRGFPISFFGLEYDYLVQTDLPRMQNNGLHNRKAQYSYDVDSRTDWLMGDSQRGKYHIEQASHNIDAYAPEFHHSLLLGKQYEEPSHISRGTY